MRILVEVEGGVVNAVYCDDEDATVFVADYDNIREGGMTSEDLEECTVDGGAEDISRIISKVHDLINAIEEE